MATTVASKKSPTASVPKASVPKTGARAVQPAGGDTGAARAAAAVGAVDSAARAPAKAAVTAAAKPASKTPAKPAGPAAGKVPEKLVQKRPQRAAVAAAPAKSEPAQSDLATRPAKPKGKLVRDSFTMPQADFALIAALKLRALQFQRPAKKSELLRAGLHALQALSDPALHAALDALVPLQPGRPSKAG